VVTLQPQAPLTHAVPVVEAVQSRHTTAEPHAFCAVPAAHMVPEQQPPLHGCVAEQVVLQLPLVHA
jgi:hypothetical protein